MKFALHLLSVLLIAIFINYKISKMTRVIAFKEIESETESKVSFCFLILVAVIIAIYTY